MTRPKSLLLTFAKEWALLALSLASGGFSVLLGVGSYLIGREPPKNGLLLILGSCSIFAAWAAWFRERKLRLETQYKQLPLLKVARGDFFQSGGVQTITQNGQQVVVAESDFTSLVLRIENDPVLVSPNAHAVAVIPQVAFLDGSGAELFKFEGRWSDSTQPGRYLRDRTIAEREPVTIYIGKKRLLDLVYKSRFEVDCYGVNDESFEFGLKRPEWRLGPGEYQVRVRIRGQNVDQTFLLKFANPAGTLPLEPISCDEIVSSRA